MITIYFGKSASGKDTFMKKAVRCGSKPIVSYTTRPMRVGEVDGVDYNFVSVTEFKELERNGKIIESRAYDTLFNGVPSVWFYGSPDIDATQEFVGVLDVDGVESYITKYGTKDIRLVFVDTDDEIRRKRAEIRGSFSETEWNRRLADDNVKFSKTVIQNIANKYKKEIEVINNNGDKPTFYKIRPILSKQE